MENDAECTCRLVGAEFRDRVTASRRVLHSAQSRDELRGGYAFQFEASSERLHQLAELIDAERAVLSVPHVCLTGSCSQERAHPGDQGA